MKREIFTAHNEKTHAFAESGTLKTVSHGVIDATGVRVIVEKKQGFVSAIGNNDIDKLTHMALEIAASSPEDEYLDISQGGPIPPVSGIYDSAIDNMDTMKEATHLINYFLDIAHETDHRFRVDSLMVDIEKTHIHIENSYGVDVEEHRTTFSMGIAGMARDKEEVSSFDYIDISDVNLENFIRRGEEEIRTFVKKVVKTLYPRKIDSYRGLLLLSPRAVADILIDFIVYHASGLRVVRNASMWKEKIDHTIASSSLTIMDNPLVDGSPYATAFDREGTPTSITPIIEKGVLKNFFLNTYASRFLGLPNTAHASGGYSSIPGVAPHCLKIEGTRPLSEMMKDLKGTVLLERFSGNINFQTGMVSGIAKNSFAIEEGNVAYGITDTMISFSAVDVLNNIVDISHEVKFTEVGPMPHILVEGVEVIG